MEERWQRETKKKSVTHLPALIIGLGGSGIRALRYIRALGKYDIEPGLGDALETGIIRLVGIDTDPKENEPNVYIMRELFRSDAEEDLQSLGGKLLPILPSNTVFIDSRDIGEIHARVRKAQASGGHDERYRSVLSWFPGDSGSTGAELELGHSKGAGAGQWRPFGRLGFVHKSRAIYRALQEAHGVVRDMAEAQGHGVPRAYVLCSLAGGTGSGGFWDISFLLRLIDQDIRTRGLFMLAGSFRELDEAGRIEQNTYAALKEIVHYKNARQSEAVEISYPIGEHGLRFRLEPGEVGTYEGIFVYDAFDPGKGSVDHAKARREAGCLRLAQNSLAMLRSDLQATIEVGANNETGDDATSFQNKDESKFVFSTTAVASFHFIMSEDLGINLLNETLSVSARALRGESCQIELAEFLTLVEKAVPGLRQSEVQERDGHEGSDFSKIDTLKSGLSKIIQGMDVTALSQATVEYSLVCAGLVALSTSDVIRTDPTRSKTDDQSINLEKILKIPSLSDPPRATASSISDLTFIKNFANLSPKVSHMKRLLRATIPGRLAEGWNRSIDRDREVSPSHNVTAEAGRLSDYFSDLHVSLRDSIKSALHEVKSTLQGEDRRPLSPAFRKVLTQACEDRSKVVGPPWEVKAPAAFLVIRISLGYGGDTLRERVGALVPVPVGLSFYYSKARDTLLALKQEFERAFGLSVAAIERRVDGLPQVVDGQSIGLLEQMAMLAATLPEDAKSLAREILDLDDVIRQERAFSIDLTNERAGRLGALRGDEVAQGKILQRAVDQIEAPSERARLAERLTSRLKAIAKRRHAQLEASLLRDSTWVKHLESLNRAVDVSRASEFVLFEHFAEQLVLGVCPLKPAAIGPSEMAMKGLDEHFKLLGLVTDVVSAVLMQDRNLFSVRAGGEDGLRRLFRSCRSNVFRGDINPIRRRKVVIIPPSDELDQEIGSDLKWDEDRHELSKLTRAAAEVELGVQPRISDRTSVKPIVYYEDRFVPAGQIEGARSYLSAYRSLDLDERRLYHVLPGAHLLPDIIDDTHKGPPIRCGHPDCTCDLRRYPRDTFVCPECHRPIKNWCGNVGCEETQLAERLRRDHPDGDFGVDCPSCHRTMRTYWWRCDQPEHCTQWVPSDKHSCPACMREFRRNHRSLEKVRRRPDLRMIECPGCDANGCDESEKLRFPEKEFGFFFRNGVNGHQTEIFKARVAEARDKPWNYGLSSSVCNRGKRDHHIFPICPTGVKDQQRRHYVFRGADERFYCSEHPDHRFCECYHCGYPIEKRQFGEEGAECPRCLRQVRSCDHCSHRDDRVFAPLTGASGAPDRCPRCHYTMDKNNDRDMEQLLSGLSRPSSCANPFGCVAGANPWRSVTELHKEGCRACAEDGSEAILIPHAQLHWRFDTCPLCLRMHGSTDGGKAETRDALAKRLATRGNAGAPTSLEEVCSVCGVRSGHLWQMIAPVKGKQTTSKRQGTKPAASGESLSPGTDRLELCLDLLDALKSEKDDRKAYRHFADDERKRMGQIPSLKTDILALFDRNHVSYSVLDRRLTALGKIDLEEAPGLRGPDDGT